MDSENVMRGGSNTNNRIPVQSTDQRPWEQNTSKHYLVETWNGYFCRTNGSGADGVQRNWVAGINQGYTRIHHSGGVAGMLRLGSENKERQCVKPLVLSR